MPDKLKILIIDDDTDLRSVLQKFLQGQGFKAESASDGPGGLKLIEGEEFHIVILDIYMPGMDGLKVLNKIKKAHPSTKVIMLTAADGIKIAEDAVRSGASEYITKPFNLNFLLETIEKLK